MIAKQNGIHLDVYQLRAIQALDRLYNDLKVDKEDAPTSFFWSSAKPQPPPKGVYLHGGVGCGKTFCMNLFFQEAPTKSKQAVHFHKFMLSVHQQMHNAKKTHNLQGSAILEHVVNNILEQGKLICFDEFQVTDVGDAMVLQRLFTSLLQQGCVIVATSNRPPSDLYLGGLQRDRFIPFIRLLEQKCQVIDMWESETDYRLVQGNQAKDVYFVGHKQGFEEIFQTLTKDTPVMYTNLSTQGRIVPVPRAVPTKGVCRFTFQELCQKALGAADYLVIGQHFHTVFLEDVPKLSIHEINWVRRFIVFIDSMYECHVKLIISAMGQPDEIFQVDLENKSHDEVFAFDRTRSRLEEMRSSTYLTKRWVGHESSEEDPLKLLSVGESNHATIKG